MPGRRDGESMLRREQGHHALPPGLPDRVLVVTVPVVVGEVGEGREQDGDGRRRCGRTHGERHIPTQAARPLQPCRIQARRPVDRNVDGERVRPAAPCGAVVGGERSQAAADRHRIAHDDGLGTGCEAQHRRRVVRECRRDGEGGGTAGLHVEGRRVPLECCRAGEGEATPDLAPVREIPLRALRSDRRVIGESIRDQLVVEIRHSTRVEDELVQRPGAGADHCPLRGVAPAACHRATRAGRPPAVDIAVPAQCTALRVDHAARVGHGVRDRIPSGSDAVAASPCARSRKAVLTKVLVTIESATGVDPPDHVVVAAEQAWELREPRADSGSAPGRPVSPTRRQVGDDVPVPEKVAIAEHGEDRPVGTGEDGLERRPARADLTPRPGVRPGRG